MTREEAAKILYQEKSNAGWMRWVGFPVDIKKEQDYKRFILAVDVALDALRGPQPDPDTGLMPCGCGGKAKVWPSEPTQFTRVITDYEVGCTECAMTTGWVRGKQENAIKVWNTAMGYTAPPRPDAGEMAQNGDEGAES